jgi:hypothetical protein
MEESIGGSADPTTWMDRKITAYGSHKDVYLIPAKFTLKAGTTHLLAPWERKVERSRDACRRLAGAAMRGSAAVRGLHAGFVLGRRPMMRESCQCVTAPVAAMQQASPILPVLLCTLHKKYS